MVLFGLAVVFAASAAFPEAGWGWIHLWAESDSEIRPTRAYVVYTRVTGAIVAVVCVVAGIVTAGIASGDTFDVVEVHARDFDATLFPDSEPRDVCERVAN